MSYLTVNTGTPLRADSMACELWQLAEALAHFLGGEAAVHRELASACLRNAQASAVRDSSGHDSSGRFATWAAAEEGRNADQARTLLHAALAEGPAWLALPFSRSGLATLQHLPDWIAAPIVCIESPALTEVLVRHGHHLSTCTAAEAVRRFRAVLAEPKPERRPGTTPLFVSFPELHALRADTTARVSFCGQTCRFALLEAAICASSLRPLITLAGAGPAAGSGSEPGSASAGGPAIDAPIDAPIGPAPRRAGHLVSWPQPQERQPASARTGERVADALAWLVAHLQACARAQPAQCLAWPHWFAASEHVLRAPRDNWLRQMQAFVDAWPCDGSGLYDEPHAAARARLRGLQIAAMARS